MHPKSLFPLWEFVLSCFGQNKIHHRMNCQTHSLKHPYFHLWSVTDFAVTLIFIPGPFHCSGHWQAGPVLESAVPERLWLFGIFISLTRILTYLQLNTLNRFIQASVIMVHLFLLQKLQCLEHMNSVQFMKLSA